LLVFHAQRLDAAYAIIVQTELALDHD